MDQQQHSNWKCPQCGLNDIGGDRYICPRCGKKRNRWGYWDCASCQTKGIRADHKECPGCGRPRARNVKFYLRDDLVEYVDEVSGNDAVRIRRANWICPYCQQQNDDAVQVCVYCGANRSESTEKYHDVKNEPEPQQQPVCPQTKRKKIPQKLACCLLMLAPLVLLFGLAGLSLFWQQASSAKVRSVSSYSTSWESEIYIEELKTFEGNDWLLPADARLLRTATENYEYIDHYERRSREVWVDDYDDDDYGWDDDDDDDWGGWDDDDGWEDYGDGQFGVFQMLFPLTAAVVQPGAVLMRYETEYYDEPVYASEPRTKYYYEYDQWVDTRTVTASGDSGTEPYYEALTLGEKERERGRVTRWYVSFTHKDSPVRMEISEEEYKRLSAGEKLYYRCDVTDGWDNPKFILTDQQS